MNAPSLLSMQGVTACYGNINALHDVSIEVPAGEIVTLIGANGAGKSTLMMTIFGNPRASEGRVVFDGRDITQMPTHEIARLGFALSPEGRRIFGRMTVEENLRMGAEFAGQPRLRARARARHRHLPAAQGAPAPAWRHAVGRRAADARHRARAHEPAEAPAAR